MITGHGGNIHEWADKLGCHPDDIVDMSSNVNPLGPIPGLTDFLCSRIAEIASLPEADASTLISRFAAFYDIDPTRVLAGNGSTQLIYSIPLALESRRVGILGPTYSDYADACAMYHVPFQVTVLTPEEEFIPRPKDFDKLASGSDTVFLCNPNNPTGVLISRQQIEEFCRNHPKIRVVVDESYLPFAPNGEAESMVETDIPNVLVLNSMSKIFRIPGLRIGFLISPNPVLVSRLKRLMLPWSVNALAQTGVIHILSEKEKALAFIRNSQDFLANQREEFRRRLAVSTALQLFPSKASFILARLEEGRTAPDILRTLIRQRILIRDCSNFTGLSNRYIRVSLKSETENHRCAEALLALGVLA